MAKRTAIPVRLEIEQGESVKKIAAACGVGEQDVIRWAVAALRDYFQHHGGRLLLPLRFHESFKVVSQTAPMVLHEPPRVRSELVRPEARSKTKTGAR